MLVGAAGIEPATPGLEIPCSIQLSYAPSRTYADPTCGCVPNCTLLGSPLLLLRSDLRSLGE